MVLVRSKDFMKVFFAHFLSELGIRNILLYGKNVSETHRQKYEEIDIFMENSRQQLVSNQLVKRNKIVRLL